MTNISIQVLVSVPPVGWIARWIGCTAGFKAGFCLEFGGWSPDELPGINLKKLCVTYEIDVTVVSIVNATEW